MRLFMCKKFTVTMYENLNSKDSHFLHKNLEEGNVGLSRECSKVLWIDCGW